MADKQFGLIEPDGDVWKRFDAEAPEFADVPLVRFTGERFEPVRGTVPEWVSDRRLARERRGGRGIYGVLTNDLGDVELAEQGEVVEDVRISSGLNFAERLTASSYDELLNVLAALTAEVEQARDAGWELVELTHGHGQLRRPMP